MNNTPNNNNGQSNSQISSASNSMAPSQISMVETVVMKENNHDRNDGSPNEVYANGVKRRALSPPSVRSNQAIKNTRNLLLLAKRLDVSLSN